MRDRAGVKSQMKNESLTGLIVLARKVNILTATLMEHRISKKGMKSESIEVIATDYKPRELRGKR